MQRISIAVCVSGMKRCAPSDHFLEDSLSHVNDLNACKYIVNSIGIIQKLKSGSEFVFVRLHSHSQSKKLTVRQLQPMAGLSAISSRI